MREIAALAYDKGNLITLDPTREPYGMNNTPDGLYTSAKGCEHYAKTQNWWDHLRCRLTVTTTEQKPRLAIQRIADQQRARNAAQQARAEQSGRPWKPRSVWSTRTYDPANYMPQECMRAQIYLDTGARAPRDGQGEHRSVTSIHEEIRQTCPDAWIISNIIEGARVLTPRKAKGSNDLIGQKVFYVPMFLAGARYADLLIENEILNMGCAVQLDYLDEFDQMAGRTLGFRFRPGSEFVAIVSPRLWSQIAHTICLESRFRLERITARPW